MKQLALFFIPVLLCQCKKQGKNSEIIKTDSTAIIDSINIVRTKHNDSIKILRTKNILRDLSGDHILRHNGITSAGKVNFTNIGRDLYRIAGSAKSGKNKMNIEGEIKMVSEKYLNFTGTITQSISENNNGKTDVRTKKTSFAKKGAAKYWRLQNAVNDAGFIDNIDIY